MVTQEGGDVPVQYREESGMKRITLIMVASIVLVVLASVAVYAGDCSYCGGINCTGAYIPATYEYVCRDYYTHDVYQLYYCIACGATWWEYQGTEGHSFSGSTCTYCGYSA